MYNTLYSTLVLILSSTFSFSQTFTGKVVDIADGDTFTLSLDGKDSSVIIHLYGIDCPEKNQNCGPAAKKFVSDLILKKKVSVLQKRMDGPHQISAIAFIGNQNVNEEILKAGYAWHDIFSDKDNTKWDMIEGNAKKERIGLWANPNPTPPWRFRVTCALPKF